MTLSAGRYEPKQITELQLQPGPVRNRPKTLRSFFVKVIPSLPGVPLCGKRTSPENDRPLTHGSGRVSGNTDATGQLGRRHALFAYSARYRKEKVAMPDRAPGITSEPHSKLHGSKLTDSQSSSMLRVTVGLLGVKTRP